MAVAEAPAPTLATTSRGRLPWWAPSLGVLAGYLGLAFLLFAHAWAHPTGMLIGNHVDSGPHTWDLAWAPYAISHGHNPLFTTWMGVPTGANIAWNTPVIAPGLATWPVSAAAGPVAAFNLVLTLGPALTAFVAYLALRRYVASRWAAILGGALAGFSPYMLAHVAAGHSNQVTALSVPLALFLLDALLIRQTRSPWVLGLALGGLAGVQMYISEEVLAEIVLVAVAGLAVLAVVAAPALRAAMWRRMLRRLAQALLAAAPVFLLLAAPMLWMQFFGPQHIVGAVRASNRYVTDLANLVVPTRLQAVAPAAASRVSDGFTGNLGEWGGYLGIPLIAGALAVAVWQWRRLLVRWAALTAVVVTVLSLGPVLHVGGHITRVPLPWRLLGRLPLLDSALPGRLMLYTFLLCAVLVAVGVEALMRERRRTVQAAGAALVALTAVTLVPAMPFASRPTAVPAFFTSAVMPSLPQGSVAYILPSVNPDTMLWQATAGMRFRMVGGWYLGPDEKGHVHDGPKPTALSNAVADMESSGDITLTTPADIARFRDELRRDGVESIVVTPYERYPWTVAKFFQQLTGTPPHDDGAGTLYWTGLRF
jgi:hypothetical protein